MSKLHLIGVGGTGHKVVNAAIHLAACGAFKGNLGSSKIDEIRVLTIDADDSNGNLSLARNTLEAYRNFRMALSGGEFGLVAVEPVTPEVNLSLYDGEKNSVNKTFNITKFANKGIPEYDFVRFLYTDAEINAEFNQGFYGHTSIGTLIVSDILNGHQVWQDFVSGINGNDFVFIAGSIFGGTGASTIPVLLEKLDAKKQQQKFKLAALMLNPYFKTAGEIQEKGELQPDADNFHVKAKASLYYYNAQEQYKLTDALYVIGEPDSNYSYEKASRGAAKQRNKAHPVELFAVTAAIDFIKHADKRAGNRVITADRDKTPPPEDKHIWTWKMLRNVNSDLPEGIQRLMKAAVFFNKVILNDLQGNGTGEWMKQYDGLVTLKDAHNHLLYENIRDYFRLFVNWMHDLHKENLPEVDHGTGVLKCVPDTRVKLFNASVPELFDNMPVKDGDIKGFGELVFNETTGKESVAVYNDIHKPPKGTARDYAAFFTVLFEILAKPQKKGLFSKKSEPLQENYTAAPYLSQKNNVTFLRPDADPNKLWTTSDPDLLCNIADGLPNTLGKTFTRDDVSIPSPWSIFIMNELTLTEESFKLLNIDAYNQWCGFIALLALRKINHYENNGFELRPLKFVTGHEEFLDAVRDTCTPNSYIFGDQKWTDSYSVMLNGEVIAFLANNTLVCPAYSFDAKTKTHLNIIAPTIVDDNGVFLPPASYFKDQSKTLNRDAKYALNLFLRELKEIIVAEAAKHPSEIIDRLNKLVDRYIGELGKTTPNKDVVIPLVKPLLVKNVYDVFVQLCPLRAAGNVELPFELEGTSAPAALIGLNICGISSASADAASIFITDTILYNRINAESIGELNGQIKDGIMLFYDYELLLDSMIVVQKPGDAVFASLAGNSASIEYDVIWPVNEKLLSVYSAQQINQMLKLTESAENVTVTLTLKTKGAAGSHSVEKTYRKTPFDSVDNTQKATGVCIIFESSRLPLWAVWPYTRIIDQNGANTWKRYNFFCVDPVYRSNAVLEIEPVFSGGTVQLAGEQKLSEVSTANDDIYYRRWTELPVMFKFKEKTGGAPKYWGAIFLAEPKTVYRGSGVWNVGLDFGTTSTTAFYTDGENSAPGFIQLLTEYKWVVDKNEPDKNEVENDLHVLCNSGHAGRRNLDKFFIDEQCLSQQGWTTAYERMDNNPNVSPTIFDTGRIFWHNHENFKDVHTSSDNRRGRILSNLKWETHKVNAGKFLNQIMTQIVYKAAQAGVCKINWFFSYPTAFGGNDKTAFLNLINGLTKNLGGDSGINMSFDAKRLLTESMAAAYFFKSKNPFKGIFLCVDIGGGTTDISIWVKKKYVFQSSIHFASRIMFIEPLRRLLERKNVLDIVRTNQMDDGIYAMLDYKNSASQVSDDKIGFFIETVLFEYYDKFQTRLNALEGEDKVAYENFKYRVFIAYTGLVYYLANIIAELLKTGKIDNETADIVFGLSGKGAKLTDWINAHCQKVYSAAQRLIQEKTSTEEKPGITIDLHDQFTADSAKTETAIGLICNLDGSGNPKEKTEEADPTVYLGCGIEVVTHGGERTVYNQNDFVDPYTGPLAKPKDISIRIDQSLSEFDEFIGFFNRVAEKTRGEIPRVNTEWFAKKKKSLWGEITIGIENVLQEDRFDPPFIVMLEVFLKEYGND